LRLFSWALRSPPHPQSIPALQRSFQLRSICLRSRLVGRPCSMLSAGSRARRSCSAAFWRAAMLSGVSVYRSCATGAGPRTPLRPCTTTVRSTAPCRKRTVSPGLTSLVVPAKPQQPA